MIKEKIKNFFNQYDVLLIITSIYLILPVLIFLVLWTKIYFPLIFVILLIWFIVSKKNEFKYINKVKVKKRDWVKIALIMVIILIWLLLSGCGGFVRQTNDYQKHNAVIHDLINMNNPVEYKLENGENGLLVYYIAYYLPAVLVGKVFGFLAANIFIFIWTFIGIAIGTFWIFRITNKISIISVILLILFSGLDFVGAGIMNGKQEILEISHKEWWVSSEIRVQLSSFTTLLYWVPHMFIPALIITPVIYFYKDKKILDIIYILIVAIFLWSPFICIGIIPFLLYNIINELKRKGIKNLISVPMFILCLFITSILILYITSNNDNGSQMELLCLKNNISLKRFIPYFMLFCILEFGILVYMLKTNIKDKNERVYLYITVAILTLLVSIYGGKYNDFAMRTTIPALIIIYIIFVKVIFLEMKNKKVLIMFLIYIILMSYTSINEIGTRIKETTHLGGQYADELKTLENFQDSDIKKQYISTSYKNTIFDKYIKKNY